MAGLFLFSLLGAQTITKGPYLIRPGYQNMIIRWEINDSVRCGVQYGTTPAVKHSAQAILRGVKNHGYLYEVTLSKLRPGTKYEYRVLLADSAAALHHFRTSRADEDSFNFVAMGDSRSNPDIFSGIVERVQKDNPAFIISMGDLVEKGGNYDQWGKFYFSETHDLTDHIPLVSTLGDHEGEGDDGELFRHFLLKEEPRRKQWFSFDYGTAHFISLDYRHADDREMINWFVKDISASNAQWKFVYFHRPVYNLGGHRSMWGRTAWPELFRRYKVDIVFAGHSHIYERFYPVRPEKEADSWPVTYITTGGAGAGLYDVSRSEYLAAAESVNHYIYLSIVQNVLQLRAIRNDGSVLDSLKMVKVHGRYSDDYLRQVKAQEGLNLQTMFMKAATFSFNYLPFEKYAAPVSLRLKSELDEDIPFTIRLSEESSKHYRMKPLSAILKGANTQSFVLEVYSKSAMTVSGWGDLRPSLRLKVTYRYKGKEITILGGPADYWPDVY